MANDVMLLHITVSVYPCSLISLHILLPLSCYRARRMRLANLPLASTHSFHPPLCPALSLPSLALSFRSRCKLYALFQSSLFQVLSGTGAIPFVSEQNHLSKNENGAPKTKQINIQEKKPKHAQSSPYVFVQLHISQGVFMGLGFPHTHIFLVDALCPIDRCVSQCNKPPSGVNVKRAHCWG